MSIMKKERGYSRILTIVKMLAFKLLLLVIANIIAFLIDEVFSWSAAQTFLDMKDENG
jgi:hypothetical protein